MIGQTLLNIAVYIIAFIICIIGFALQVGVLLGAFYFVDLLVFSIKERDISDIVENLLFFLLFLAILLLEIGALLKHFGI